MNTAEKLLKRALEAWETDDGYEDLSVFEEIRAYLATEEINTSPEPNPPIGARLPNGAVVTNVYEAYEEGLKESATPRTEQEPVAWMYSRGDVFAGNPVTLVAATTGKDFAFQKPHFDQKPLFLHPAPRTEQEPPSLNEVVKAFNDSPACGELDNFIAGFLFAKKHYGFDDE